MYKQTLALLLQTTLAHATIVAHVSASSLQTLPLGFDFSGVDLIVYRGGFTVLANGVTVPTSEHDAAAVAGKLGSFVQSCPNVGTPAWTTRTVRCRFPGIGVMYVIGPLVTLPGNKTSRSILTRRSASIGGASLSQNFSIAFGSPASRTTFLQSLAPILARYDGIEIDWQWPMGGSASLCTNSASEDDVVNYVSVAKEFKTLYPAKILSATVFNDPSVYEERAAERLGTTYLGLLVAHLDYVIVQAHSYRSSAISPFASLTAPMLSQKSVDPLQSASRWGVFVSSVQESLEAYLLQYFIDVDKLLLEVDFRGRAWSAPGLWQPCAPALDDSMLPTGEKLCAAPKGDRLDVFIGADGQPGPASSPVMGICGQPGGWSGVWNYVAIRNTFLNGPTSVDPTSGYKLKYHLANGAQQATLENGNVVISFEDVRSVVQKVGAGKTWAVNGIVVGDVGRDWIAKGRGELTFAAVVEFLGYVS